MGEEALHILVLTDRDWTHPQGGGTGTNLLGQVSRWLAWGHRVSIVAAGHPGAPPHERFGDLTIHRLGGRTTIFPHAIVRQAFGLVPDADVALEVVNGITFLTPLWLRMPHVGLIHHIHRDHYVAEMGSKGRFAAYALETAPLQRLYRSTRFITVSEATAGDVIGHGIPPESVDIVYNGVEADMFGPGERAPVPTLVHLGRLKRYKRIELLLDALERIPNAELDLIGEGDHRPVLEREIADRGLGSRVRLHGFVSDMAKAALLRRAWLHLCASSAEGWCLAVAEAAACATPTVALSVGGLRESVQHGRTGLLASTPDELHAHVGGLLANRDLRARLGEQALARARSLSWERTASETLAVLRRARAEHRSASRRRQLPALPVQVARRRGSSAGSLSNWLGSEESQTLATAVGQKVGLEARDLAAAAAAARLRNVGKVAIPPSILDKPGPLQDGEWQFVRRHPLVGERIVDAAAPLRAAAPLVRSSHERFDGSGYPDGLAGREIPAGSRVVAVTSAWEAMTSHRPHRDARTPLEALGELQRQAGSFFDPDVVDAFCESVEPAAGRQVPAGT